SLPMVLPKGAGPSFEGVVSILGDGGDLADQVKAIKETLVERTVEADDALMERYLEGQEISDEEFRGALSKAVAQGTVIPVLCGSVEQDLGVEELLDVILQFTPAHDAGREIEVLTGSEGEETTPLDCKADAPFRAFVFKTLSDPYVGKLSFLRVMSGTISNDDSVLDVRVGKPQKMSNLMRMQGKEQKPVDKVTAGDIVAVSKIEDFEVGDTLCDPSSVVRFKPVPLPSPMASLAVEPKSRGDEQKIGTALTKLSSEDPGFMAHRDPNTGEMLINGMSTMHLDVVMERMKRRFGVEVVTHMPKIPYKETITTPAEGHHRHKKQSGGRGQFGEVYIRVAPRGRGEGYEFVDKIVGGSVPRQYIPAVDKGIHERMKQGVIAGCEVVDCTVELYDGKYHDVDSDELSFKLAGGRAFIDAFEKAKPVLLEPVMDLEIAVPSRFMGDISGDLNSRRGRIQGMDAVGDLQVIRAQVPLASVVNYSTELRSITAGEGDFSMEFSHFDIVPPQEQQKIVAAFKASKEEE
ncbi:MAG: elongation factor G, partial [Planctomycetota bacterium]